MILKSEEGRGQGRTHEKTHDYDTQTLRQDPAAKRSRDRKVFPACRVRQGLTETRRGQRRTSTPKPVRDLLQEVKRVGAGLEVLPDC